MIKVPTVLILGAGASKPYGFPTGIELKNAIIDRLKDRTVEINWVEDLDDNDHVQEFVRKLNGSTRLSIDSFLNYHKDYEEIGKKAIADIISTRENRDKLLCPTDDNWYSYLAEFLCNCDFDDISDNKIGIISYKYDRSLESFLYNAIRSNYKEGESNKECAAKIQEIPIIHMYGRLDPLPWEYLNGRKYGEPCIGDDINDISKSIRLIQDATKEGIPKQADELIKDSKMVYFLGLDLRRKENIELLDLKNLLHKSVYGSAYGLEMSEIRLIERHINRYSAYANKQYRDSYRSTIKPEKSLSMIRTYGAFR